MTDESSWWDAICRRSSCGQRGQRGLGRHGPIPSRQQKPLAAVLSLNTQLHHPLASLGGHHQNQHTKSVAPCMCIPCHPVWPVCRQLAAEAVSLAGWLFAAVCLSLSCLFLHRNPTLETTAEGRRPTARSRFAFFLDASTLNPARTACTAVGTAPGTFKSLIAGLRCWHLGVWGSCCKASGGRPPAPASRQPHNPPPPSLLFISPSSTLHDKHKHAMVSHRIGTNRYRQPGSTLDCWHHEDSVEVR